MTYVASEEHTVDSILGAIAEGRTTVVGKRTPWRVSFRQAGGAAKRRIKYAVRGLLPDVTHGLL